MRFFGHTLAFAFWRHRMWIVLWLALLVILVLFFSTRMHAENPPPHSWAWIDMFVTLSTLFVALLVWIGEATQDWENNLPKRLKVVYLHGDQPAMVCEDATLISENDIRAMAQQIGAQINHGRLELSPHFDLQPAKNELIVENNKRFVVRRFEIHIELTELPNVVKVHRTKHPTAVIIRRKQNGIWQDECHDGYPLVDETA